VFKAHCFHGACGRADIARVAGLAEYNSNVVKDGK
jgi:hypothetical protein